MEKDILHPINNKVTREEGRHIRGTAEQVKVYIHTQKISEGKWTVHSKLGKQ